MDCRGKGPQSTYVWILCNAFHNAEARVDYGTGPVVRDPNTGRYPRTRLSVLTLGHSAASPAWSSSTTSARASMTSMFNAGFAMTQRQNQSILAYPSVGQLAGKPAARDMTKFGSQVTRWNLNLTPGSANSRSRLILHEIRNDIGKHWRKLIG